MKSAVNIAWQVARRHLSARRRQSAIATLGVMFGITVFIIQAGVITGFQQTFIQTIIENTPHIQLYREDEVAPPPILDKVSGADTSWNVAHHIKISPDNPRIDNPYAIIKSIEAHPLVFGVSPLVKVQVFFRSGGVEVPGALEAVDPVRENKLFKLEEDIIDGEWFNLLSQPDGVVLGAGLAKKLNVGVGDRIQALSAEGALASLKVVALHQSGVTQVDKTRGFVVLKKGQTLRSESAQFITDLNIKVKDVNKAGELATELKRRFNYTALDWKTANERFFSIFFIQNLITYIVIISILVVSGFGIFNILNMMIYEKMGDIAILKSMGFTSGDILGIFLWQAIIVGLIGSLLGLILGFVVSYGLSVAPLKIEGEVTINGIQVNFDPRFYVAAYLFGTLISTLAGYFPARRAAQMDPVIIIRNRS